MAHKTSDKNKKMSYRKFNYYITLLGSFFGFAVPQNKEFSEHAHDPIPDDIRGNRKEGDEYDTIGDVLRKGGKRKTVLIAVLILCLVLVIVYAVFFWGVILGSIPLAVDYNRSGITEYTPRDEELARITEIDPEAARANDNMELLKFHTKGGLLITLRCSENGEWKDIDKVEINSNEGYLFPCGSPSSVLELHVITDGKSIRHITRIGDGSYPEDDTPIIDCDQLPLRKEQIITLYYNPNISGEELFDDDFYKKLLKDPPAEKCYMIVAQDMESAKSVHN